MLHCRCKGARSYRCGCHGSRQPAKNTDYGGLYLHLSLSFVLVHGASIAQPLTAVCAYAILTRMKPLRRKLSEYEKAVLYLEQWQFDPGKFRARREKSDVDTYGLLGKQADMHIDSLQKYQLGHREPAPARIVALARALQCEPLDLCRRVET